MTSTRRSFLGAAVGAGLCAPLAAAGLQPARPAPTGMRMLILGGTGFTGPHIVRAALARGHSVTLFNRGKTHPGLFPQLEHLAGDRDKGDLASLQGREFDVVVDTSGYVPAHVDATARLFGDKCKHYTMVSSISVYGAFGARAATLDETAEVSVVDDDKVAAVDTIRASMPFYGALKARCEAAAEAAMPGRVACIRPGLIVGPGDNSDRFTWWPVRVDRGGEVLAPGEPDAPVQCIDARDLAEWIVHAFENQVVGVYNAVGFTGTVTMGDLLSGCKCATSAAVELTWASEQFLQEHDVGAWMEMPLWIPSERRSRVVNTRAVNNGLRFRPLADTIRDTLQWARTERGDGPFERTGVKPDKERALLQAWHRQAKAAGR